MSRTVSTNDQPRRKRASGRHVDRRQQAIGLFERHASGADRWQFGHRKRDGKAFFGVPSSEPPKPGQARLYHLADQNDCSCDDRRRKIELDREHACKHMLAVRLWFEAFKRGEVGVPGQGTLTSRDRAELHADAEQVAQAGQSGDVADWPEWDRELLAETGGSSARSRANDGRPVWLRPGDRWGDEVIPGDVPEAADERVPAPGQGGYDG
jgi:hypothetical protein